MPFDDRACQGAPNPAYSADLVSKGTTNPWTTALVGRDREVGILREAVTLAAAGQGQVLLVEGEPGIGKTRLVETACEQARAAGFGVAMGGCDDLAPARPFAALIDALGTVSSASDPERAAIAALIDSSAAPENTSLGGPNPGMHYRVVESLGALVERVAERAPLFLALDDVQWADVSTLTAARFIAKRAQTLPVLLLISARTGHDSAELHRVTDDLLRASAIRLALKPLDEKSVTALITEVMDSSPSDALLHRAEGANGNPLFLIEYVRSIQSASVDGGGSSAPLDFRLTVLRRLATLPGATSEALRLAAVLGSTFSPADLAIVSGRSVVELAPVLQQAVVSAMVEERGPQLAFRHMLVRDAIYEQIPVGVRQELHREAGHALAAAGADALTVAHHLGLGADAEDTEAAEWLRRAARGVAPRSPATAVELLRRACDLLGPTSPVRNEILAELAVAMAWSGQLADAAALGLDVLKRRPSPAVAGPLRCGLVYALTWQGRPAEALRHAVLGPGERISDWDAALLRALAAVASVHAFDFHSAASHADEAATSAEQLGHEVALCHALTAQTWIALFASRLPDAVELGLRAVDLADRSTSGEAHLAHPRFYVAQPLMGVNRFDEAEEMLRSGLRLAERLGLAWSFPLYHSRLGSIGFIKGDWDSATAEIEACQAVAAEVGLHGGPVAVASAWLAAIQVHRDDLEAAERTLATAVRPLADTGPQLGMAVIKWAQALVLEARNQPDEALDLLESAVDMYKGGKQTDPWSTIAFVRLCASTGNPERAAPVVRLMDDLSGGLNPVGRGQAMRTRGLVEQDPDALVKAVALSRGAGQPLQLAESCEDAAVLLAAAHRIDEAVPMWSEATVLYEGLGAQRDVARVWAQLRQHGVTRGNRSRLARASTGWESLTGTEHKVIALVAQRFSNSEVAERLFISRHTVESHLKHVYRKLELSSRKELAALFVRRSENLLE